MPDLGTEPIRTIRHPSGSADAKENLGPPVRRDRLFQRRKPSGYLGCPFQPEVLEIGGGYGADYTYLAIKNNWLLLVSCGVWE